MGGAAFYFYVGPGLAKLPSAPKLDPASTIEPVSPPAVQPVPFTIPAKRTPDALMSDTDYCKKLSEIYRHYRRGNVGETVAKAMSKCEAADAVSAILVLEKALADMQVALPTRELPGG